MGADLCITGCAFAAVTAAAYKWYGDTIADFVLGYAVSNCMDRACEFVSERVWELRDIRVMAHPGMPIAATETRCFNLDDDLVRG